MAGRKVVRRLSAILAADVAGYSRLVARDEEGTLQQFAAHLADAIAPAVAEHGGRIFKTTGDGLLAEFASSLGAIRAALQFQAGVAARNREVSTEERLEFRVGVHTADVVVEHDDLLGDGVNIAARLEALALPGGVAVSGRVWDDIRDRVDVGSYDLGEQQLKNMPKPVRVLRLVSEQLNGTDVRSSLPLPTKPSIAVLPFDNMSGDPEQEYFADALTDDIVIALSRWRWFLVIARDSSFAFKGAGHDAQRIGEQLGVRYLLQGSVRRSGRRVRVSAQLVDAISGAHIWAENFDRELVDIFVLQDEITEQVVGAIEPAMLQSEGARVARKNPGDLTAFDCFQRGMWHFNKTSAEGLEAALKLFGQAIERDPELALAHVGLARSLYGRALYGWTRDRRADFEAAAAAADTAIALDPRDAIAYYALSGALLYTRGPHEALDPARKAVALNPNFAYGHVRVGQVLTLLGRARDAIAPIERGIRRNPYDPQLGVSLGTLSLAYYLAEDYEQSVVQARAALARGYRGAIPAIVASLARLDRMHEAEQLLSREDLERAVGKFPRLVATATERDREHVSEGLQLAAEKLRQRADAPLA